MSKAILVMDMPNFCDQCPIVALDEEIGFYCPKMMNTLPEMIAYKAKVGDYFYKGKPDWCPLIPEPNRREPGDAVEFTEDEPLTDELADKIFNFGFNECLAVIEEMAEDDKENE